MDFILSEYAIAWIVYLLAFLVLYSVVARIVWYLPLRILRQSLKGLFAVMLLTPVASPQADGWLMPAWLNFSYGLILGQDAELGPTLFNFFLAVMLLVLALIVDAGWHRLRRR